MPTSHAAPGARATPVLSVRGLVQRYGPTVALAGVDLDLGAGEVLGLVGANGAGKSTLVRVLTGAERPAAGELRVDGRAVQLAGPGEAAARGIACVHQDVDAALVPDLTVAENLLLPALAAGTAPGSARRLRRAATAIADTAGLDLGARVSTLTTAAKQRVLIARALAGRPRVLVLDEPTAALSVAEARALLDAVRELAAAGTAVVLISHHLAEVTDACDRAVVLREGRVVADLPRPFAAAALVGAMLGDLAPAARGRARRVPDGGAQEVLALRGLRAWPGGRPVDLVVRRGEVVGLTGLLGAGKTELLEQVVGARPLLDGEVEVLGRAVRVRHPADAVAAGLGFVPEDRAVHSELADWDVRRNVTLAGLRAHRRRGLLSPRLERAATREVIDRLGIVCAGPGAPLRSLSGGNRQKVAVGRWLAAGSRVLVLDEPFRGIDLGARADLAALLRSGAVEGALVAASDPEEVLEVADRVLVLADGAVVGEVRPGDVDADELAAAMATHVPLLEGALV